MFPYDLWGNLCLKVYAVSTVLCIIFHHLVCVMLAVMPVCELQHILKRAENRSRSPPLLLCPVWSAHCHAYITAAGASFCCFLLYNTDLCKSFREPCFSYRKITGAYFNASQSSLQCLCGNLAVLTRYLKESRPSQQLWRGAEFTHFMQPSWQPQLISNPGWPRACVGD